MSTLLFLLLASADGGTLGGQVYETIKSSVVLIEERNDTGEVIGGGTGFFVSADGLLVTNHHVANDAEHLTAVLADGSKQAIVGLYVADETVDVAILRVAARPEPYPFLQLRRSTDVQPGMPVFVVGSPSALGWSLSEGILSAIRDGMPEQHKSKLKGRILQFTAPIARGSSGSPIVDSDARVIGIVHSKTVDANIGFGAPSEAIEKHLPKPDAKPLLLGSARYRTRNILISAGVLLVVAALLILTRRSTR
jgi:serine protease Do